MDITPADGAATQPISDDQELAQALAGVLPETEAEAAPADASFAFDNSSTSPSAPGISISADPTALGISLDPVATAAPESTTPATSSTLDSTPVTSSPLPVPTPVAGVSNLDSIKNSALTSLRPLMGKVELPPEEKFDTYLMLLRSTDDVSLIEPAHAAAQGIEDEKRKAEALLEIIKEIDYLSRKDQAPKA